MPRAQRTDGKRKGTRRTDTPKKDAAVAAGITQAVPMPNGGPPALVLEENVLYEMAKTMSSYDVLGQIFGVSGAHIQQTYAPLVEKARAEAKKNLAGAQFTSAVNDRNPTMLIWLGKQYLEQKDIRREEQTGPDGKPIMTDNTHRSTAVAYIPDNGRDPALQEPKPGVKRSLVAGAADQ